MKNPITHIEMIIHPFFNFIKEDEQELFPEGWKSGVGGAVVKNMAANYGRHINEAAKNPNAVLIFVKVRFNKITEASKQYERLLNYAKQKMKNRL